MSDSTPSAEAPKRIRVLAADRTRMNSQLLAEALSREQSLTVLETEPTADAIMAAVSRNKPDVVLMSAELKDNPKLGLRAARQLHAEYPNVRVVILLDTSERGPVLEAFRAGARGVFSRADSLTSLAKCISCVHEGQVWANSRELGYLADAVSRAEPLKLAASPGSAKLSKREMDVVQCVVEGLSNRETAHRLGLTEHTVKNYLLRIFDKLGVTNRVGVVLYAFSLGQSENVSSPPTETAQDRVTHPSRNHVRNPSKRSTRN
jgi:DNA-binding NarL/FixJ family response regulator